MQLRRLLTYCLIATYTALYSQVAIGLKIQGLGLHPIDMKQDPAIFENSLTGTQSAIVELGYELNLQQFLYATILSLELRQGFHSDAAAKMAGHLGLGLRWKFFHKGRSSISISVAPTLTFRRTWDNIEQYVNHHHYRDYKTSEWYQYKYLVSGELVYNVYVGKRSDVCVALSYNNAFQTFGFSVGYRHWINPYVKVKEKNCSSCGAKGWRKNRFRKFWRKIWK